MSISGCMSVQIRKEAVARATGVPSTDQYCVATPDDPADRATQRFIRGHETHTAMRR
ncbi:MAG: hypothetical protein V4793_17525 [Paraburkholderia tropica]